MISNNPSDSPEVTPGGGGIKAWFNDFMDLREGMDREGAVVSITSNKLMRGSNAWMLVCSIMIASLGLNLNSGAVIIGAMLISPLMNPILGVGLGVGTNDRELLWVALQNFGVSILIALVTSYVYFFFTPLDLFTSEMRARTEPTILDGLVAVFGGLAGIISVTRADKTNAIPGVAIATALMPPLCVAGYGLVLATKTDAGLEIFWRAFYLFFLNSFFIAATAYLIIRLLRFPYRKYMNKEEARRSQLIIALISLLMIAPGIFILQEVLTRQNQEKAALNFTERYFPASVSTYLLDRREPKSPKLVYPFIDRMLPPDSLDHYSMVLREPPYAIAGARLVVDTSYNPSEISRIKGQLSTLDGINNRLRGLETSQGVEIRERLRIQQEMLAYRMDTLDFVRLSNQFLIAFPQVATIRVARAQVAGRYGPDDEPRYEEDLPIVVLTESRNRRGLDNGARTQVQRYLKEALRVDTLLLVVE